MLVFKSHSGETEHNQSAAYTHRYSESDGRAQSEKWRLGSTFQGNPGVQQLTDFSCEVLLGVWLAKSLTSASSRPWWTIALRV